MNQEIKGQWVSALLSGRYLKGVGYLLKQTKGINRYCPLGVLCDLYRKAGGYEWVLTNDYPHPSYIKIYSFGGFLNFPPLSVKIWAGLDDVDPAIPDNAEEYKAWNVRTDYDCFISVSYANDIGLNFKQVAHLINRYL